MRSNRASNRLDYVRKIGSSFYDSDDSAMAVINEEMIDLFDRVSKKSAQNADRGADVQAEGLEVQSQQFQNQSEFLGEVDPALEGQAQNASNRLQIQSDQMSKEINSTMSKIVHRLSDKASKGDTFSEAVLLILNVLRLRSLNFNTGPKGSSFGLSF